MGVATFYDRSGQVLPQIVTIPAAPSQPLGPVGRPTGIVYNPTSDFVISENGKSAPAEFFFDARDGTISGWNPAVDPDHAIIMVDNSTAVPSITKDRPPSQSRTVHSPPTRPRAVRPAPAAAPGSARSARLEKR